MWYFVSFRLSCLTPPYIAAQPGTEAGRGGWGARTGGDDGPGVKAAADRDAAQAGRFRVDGDRCGDAGARVGLLGYH
jgi:hypothetical protein